MSSTSKILVLAAAFGAMATADGWVVAGQPAAAASGTTQNSASEAPQEVIVTGRRSLAKRIRNFVNQVAVEENAEGVAVWKTPVCAFVTGFPPQQGGVIQRRLPEVARAAHVPLDGVDCYPPNLLIVETDDPEGLLQEWDNDNTRRLETFNSATDDLFAGSPQSVVERFIATPRAVRVWYYTHREDAADLTVSPETAFGPPEVRVYEPTRIESHGVLYDFFRIFVIVDKKRLQGVTISQLADYISMVGLAKLKPDAHPGDAPTILKLFDGTPQSAPSGLTLWDQAFLSSLYASDQKSTLQRSQIVRAMVRDIAH